MAGIRMLLLAVLAACVVSTATAAPPPSGAPQKGAPANGAPPNGGQPNGAPSNAPNPAAQCAQNYAVGSPQYNGCVAGSGTPQGSTPQPYNNGSTSTLTAAQQAAISACKAQGLVENTDAYMNCIKDQTGVTATPTDPKTAAAFKVCDASGLNSKGSAFQACVTSEMSKPTLNLTPKQKPAYDACAAKGFTYPSDGFTKCFATEGLPTTSDATKAQINAAIAACNGKKGITNTSACVQAALK